MKDAIRKVLDKYSDSKLDLSSNVFKDVLTEQIYQEILLHNKMGNEEAIYENDETSDCGGV